LFFLWGFANSTHGVLNKFFQDALQLKSTDTAWIQAMVYGGYFLMAIPASKIISKFGYKSDVDFCVDLAQKIGVGAVPASCFFKEDVHHLIRLHFAKKDETLNEALNRLEKINTLIK
jgi:aspartate/methionine/tyrosine aminotransferase